MKLTKEQVRRNKKSTKSEQSNKKSYCS
jgi:hypothetical protein